MGCGDRKKNPWEDITKAQDQDLAGVGEGARNMSHSRQTDRGAGAAETHPVEEGGRKGRKTVLGRRQEVERRAGGAANWRPQVAGEGQGLTPPGPTPWRHEATQPLAVPAGVNKVLLGRGPSDVCQQPWSPVPPHGNDGGWY